MGRFFFVHFRSQTMLFFVFVLKVLLAVSFVWDIFFTQEENAERWLTKDALKNESCFLDTCFTHPIAINAALSHLST